MLFADFAAQSIGLQNGFLAAHTLIFNMMRNYVHASVRASGCVA